MKQTIRHLRLLARHMGISLPELLCKRAARDGMVAYVNDAREVRIRPRLYVCPDLPDSYQILPKTLIR